jgi:hypothetical protein
VTADARTPVSLPDAAMRAAVLKALLDEVKKAYDAARAQADTALLELHTGLGVRSIEVRLAGIAAPIAQITVSQPSAGLAVDEAGLLDYCTREHPSEVEEIPARMVVRAAWRKALLGRLVVDDGAVVDPTTGRVLDFVTATPAVAASTTMTLTTGGRAEVAAGHRAGRLSLPELMNPELTDGVSQ